jgi:diguanylate cyclase (GGDEF)-like protein
MSNEFTLPATNVHLTISIGITTCTSFDRLDAQQIILSADTALYKAKRSGKNRVCFNDDNDSAGKEVMILSKV